MTDAELQSTSFSIPQSLRNALEGTGRTRGSAATPVLSPTPNRAFQSQIDNLYLSSTNLSNMSPASSNNGKYYQAQNQGAHNRQMSSSTQLSGNLGFGQSQNQGHRQTQHNRRASSGSNQSSNLQSPSTQHLLSGQEAASVSFIHP